MCSGREYTVQVVEAWVLLEETVPFTGLSALRLLRTGHFGAPGIASPFSGHAIRAFGAVVA